MAYAETLLELSRLDPKKLDEDPDIRHDAIRLAKQLIANLEAPKDVAVNMISAAVGPVVVRSAIDLGIFDFLAPTAGSATFTTAQIAAVKGCEELLTLRILRYLAGIGFIEEVAPGQWRANAVTRSMAEPSVTAGHRVFCDIMTDALPKLPMVLKNNRYRSPVEPNAGVVQYANKTQLNVYEFMAKERPDSLQDFALYMGNTFGADKFWLDWFPAQSRLFDGCHGKSALIVDVGGGKGHDLQALARAFPDLKGSLVLQDLPATLANVDKSKLDSRIVCRPQDFFLSNVERGARAYYLHHVFHNWSDKYASIILRNLAEAMDPQYSKVVIDDLVLPDSNVTPYQARVDMTMMAICAGVERSRAQWQVLLEQNGFKIVEFWHGPYGEDATGIIEAVLAK